MSTFWDKSGKRLLIVGCWGIFLVLHSDLRSISIGLYPQDMSAILKSTTWHVTFVLINCIRARRNNIGLNCKANPTHTKVKWRRSKFDTKVTWQSFCSACVFSWPITVINIIFGRDCSRLGHFKVLFCFTINLTAKVMKTEIKHWNLKRIHSRFQGSDLPSKSRAQDHIHIAQNLSWKTRLKGVVRWTIWMSKKIRVCLNLFYL